MVQPARQPRRHGARLIRLLRAPLLAAFLLCHGALAQQQWLPGTDWDRLPPAKSGWSETGLADARQLADRMHATGVMIVHHGAVVGEWGDTQKRTEPRWRAAELIHIKAQTSRPLLARPAPPHEPRDDRHRTDRCSPARQAHTL